MNDASKQCIFCPHVGKLTDEHIWGDWTRAFVPRPHKKHDFVFVSVPEPGKQEPDKPRLRAGDPLNAQVKIVCRPCNTGWMSQIQERAKPYLIPLFEGHDSVLDTRAQTMIATWATMATITGEYLSRRLDMVTVTRREAEWFRRNQRPFKHIRVWIGRYPREKWRGQWVHASFPIHSSKDSKKRTALDKGQRNLQTTAFVVGKLYVFTMSSKFRRVVERWNWRTDDAAHSALTQIWPIQFPSVFWPVQNITDFQAESFASAFVRYSADIAQRFGYLSATGKQEPPKTN